jgi:hypothetical protein
MSTTFTIADDCDPDGDISPNANPVEECLTYMSHVAHGAVGNMGFSAADFETYLAGLQQTDLAKIFTTLIADHHEMLVRLAKR